MSPWGKVASSVAIQYFGRTLGLLVSLASTAILTRTLGVALYGEYTTALAIAALVVTFADLGFFWSTIKSLNVEGDAKTIASEISGIRFVVASILTALMLLIVWQTSYPLEVKQAVSVLGIFTVSGAMNNVLIAVFQQSYAMVTPTVAEAASRIVNLGLIMLGYLLGKDLIWFISAVSIASVTGLLINWAVLSWRNGVIWPKIIGFSWKKYYRSVAVIGAVMLFNALYLKVDVIVLSALKSSVDVGIYGAAQRVIEVAMVFQSLFLAAAFPLFLARFREGSAQFSRTVTESLMVVLAFGLPVALVLALFSGGLINFIAGREFLETTTLVINGTAITAATVLAVLSAYVLLAHVGGVIALALLTSDHLRWLFWVNVGAFLVNIGMNLVLIPHYSYLAAAAMTVVTELIIVAANFYYLWSRHRPAISGSTVGRLLGSATLAGLVALFLPSQAHVLVKVVVTVALYGTAVFLTVPALRALVVRVFQPPTEESQG
ncbi:hypothetical protein A3A71_00610 [Candidatus Berkelbacteria bacterium RIFCSPLOWO2_01_FULL_50_28]|uniref:Uncharacterized protein n=1 Tax=Candidatus Berkelbacteria bacterium RIFCSPLOWO2_01_FULL_50_28 TaxID=1797471 RepID=A0A1F5EB01_9BACT|nr:MAG: hypothetical protein A2807_00355 [Candidatus Berkelbacteria bacterium RIFCSPHIGHO2_01_FULL_50_36]OGD62916.1 MAG: hypothetical protein A3F39_04120 [Candidatus Berkelbacteria bacterium RIFCSPHIGHO2_12_FULL_50_11]OGD64543.1 MAG: hypothetical protein A3A71_00610 [Candidatus Berkelbacteria bacterium RIFCSPLOWO2_01_FULL_50_28]